MTVSCYGVSAYACGEITAKFLSPSQPIKGRSRGAISQPFGVSHKGRKKIRRAINGHLSMQQQQTPIFVTLTTQHSIPDMTFRRQVANWIKRGKNLHPLFRHYVVSLELHQSGQMHSHIFFFEPMPRNIFLKQRELWANYYDNGVYSVDVVPVQEGVTAAAGYLSKLPKYMAKDDSGNPRPIRGRSYTISHSLLPYSK